MVKVNKREVFTSFICKQCSRLVQGNIFSKKEVQCIKCHGCGTLYYIDLQISMKKGDKKV